MKKLILILMLMLAAVSPAHAQYGDTTDDVLGDTDEHPARDVDAGLADLEVWQMIALMGSLAMLATVTYKASYRLYIFER